jgi:hypothetical protein
MMQQRFLTKLVCLLHLLLCGSALAHAQQNSVGVSPASVESRVKRGSTYQQTYTLFNNTGERLRIRCSLLDYWYDEHNKRVTGRPGTLPRSASPWVQFSPAEVLLEAHSSANVKATVTVPLAAAGGYYTMPVFEAMPVKNDPAPSQHAANTANASIGIRFRGLLMLLTEDAIEYNVEVRGGEVSPPTPSTPLELSLDVFNRSTAHARVRGILALLDSSGKLVGRAKIEEKRYMPGQRDAYKAVWAGELPPGRYTALITLTYERAGLEAATLVYEIPFAQNAVEVPDDAQSGKRATAIYSDGTSRLSTASN